MNLPDCPSCGADTPRRLDGVSADKEVWYWRCDHCGHLWNVSRIDEFKIRHLTPLSTTTRATR